MIISAREKKDAFYITVEDDGSGFSGSTSQQNQRQQVGLRNVKIRLAAQCGGSLDIHTRESGTSVIITIPKGESS